ncbi:thioredoxin family protein [Oceanobacillus sp. CF4.6]|uniref:thioredoxin family protein n=1 Tax=Oceanobacillus sp. CF4.6 TaxID=3373080 RepID=UPI003EE70570
MIKLSFLYISRPNCSVCHGLLPQVRALMGKYPEIKLGHINAEAVEEVAGRFSIFTVPVLLLFVDGKEYVREARIVHMDLFEEKLDKIYENVVR